MIWYNLNLRFEKADKNWQCFQGLNITLHQVLKVQYLGTYDIILIIIERIQGRMGRDGSRGEGFRDLFFFVRGGGGLQNKSLGCVCVCVCVCRRCHMTMLLHKKRDKPPPLNSPFGNWPWKLRIFS